MIDDFLKIRRIGVQPFRKLRPTDARRAMAIRAVMCGECLGTRLHARRIVDGGGGSILRMAIDRCRPNLDQRPTDDCRVLDGTGDTIKAAEEKYRRADADFYRKHADHRKDTHVSSPMC